MMQLHQLNQLAYPNDIEQTWINSLKIGDTLCLIEEAILRCQTQHDTLKALIEQKDISLFYLKSDTLAYGVNPTLGTALSDDEWVHMTLTSDTNISW
ncbi:MULTISPECIES: DsrH/TusB family sulfur metabolism protein [Marinomonas]|uniref:DsrH/TusB family sulfur metabolism protein n=1 Tax=Marinomonas TaxID=28253 RepID=UPI001F0AAA7B|nr:DsrH/TusB family sulfur metabolism protein [Marinomonas flavescens]